MITLTYISGRNEIFFREINTPINADCATRAILARLIRLIDCKNVLKIECRSPSEINYTANIYDVIFPPLTPSIKCVNLRFFHTGKITAVYDVDNKKIVIEYILISKIWLYVPLFFIIFYVGIFAVIPCSTAIYLVVSIIFFHLMYLLSYITFFLFPAVLWRYRLRELSILIKEIPSIELSPAFRKESSYRTPGQA